MHNSITDVKGIKVGHYTDREGITGCTVILCEEGAVGGIDIRGGAAGTREVDPLRPGHVVEKVNAILLTGGSAFGLDAAAGVARYLEERGKGHRTRAMRVPIVPTAVIYDLAIGSREVRPGADEGYKACLSATDGPVEEGSVGAGTGATVGKLLGMEYATKGGLGTVSATIGDGIVVGVLVVVNALGNVIDPSTGKIIAGVRDPGGGGFLDPVDLISRGALPLPSHSNSTLAVVATNARLSREEAIVVARMAQAGLARVIRPAHTLFDGDVVFTLATGEKESHPLRSFIIGAVAAELLAQAIIRAVLKAEGLGGIPSAREITKGAQG